MTWGSLATKSLTYIIIIPLVLKQLPTNEIALWFLFANVIALGYMLDFGFTHTFVRLVAYLMGGARNLESIESEGNSSSEINWDELRQLYGNMGTIFTMIGVVLFAALATVGTLSITKLVLEVEDTSLLWLAWSLICIGLPLSFIGQKYDAMLRGMNEIALINRWNTLFNLGMGLTLVAILLGGGQLYMLVLATQLWGLATVIRNRILLWKLLGDRATSIRAYRFSERIFHVAWTPAWRTAILSFSSLGISNLSALIFAQYASSTDIAIYLLSLRIMNLISQFSWAPFYSILPYYSQLKASGNLEKLRHISLNRLNRSLYVFIVGSFAFGMIGEYLFTLIESEVGMIPKTLWMLMMLAWFLERHHAMHAQIYMTTNKVPFYISTTISGMINIALLLYLVPQYGMWAPPISLFISNLLVNNWYSVWKSLRMLGISFSEYFLGSFKYPVAVTIISLALIYYV